MGIDSGVYKVLLVAHILCAIAGFGTSFFNGLYARESKGRPGPGGLAISQANLSVSLVAEKLIYAVFVLGIVLVLVSDEAWKFEQTWVWLSMLLYLIGIGISHGVLIPGVKRINALLEEMVSAGPPPAGAGGPPPQAARVEELGKRVGQSAMVLHLLLVAILCLMVFKPGT